MKLKRVTAAAIILLMPYVIGSKKLDDGIVLEKDKNTYKVEKLEETKVEIEENEEPEDIVETEDFTAYINEETEKGDLYLEKYQKVNVLEKYNDTYLIETEDYEEEYVNEDIITKLPENYIEVDISNQTLKLYSGNDEILTSDVVTGKNSTPTDLGYYEVAYKDTDVTLKGSNGDGTNYASFVSYWMPFNGGEGFHDATWRSTFGGSIYEDEGSHGCVNMPYENAKELFNNIESGTKVLIHK